MAYNPDQMRRMPAQGVVPYYPTPEERAMAIPAAGSSPMPAPTGMFGRQLQALLQPEQSGHISSILSNALSAPPSSLGGGSMIGRALADHATDNDGAGISPPSAGLPATSPGMGMFGNRAQEPITVAAPDPGQLPMPSAPNMSLDLTNARVKQPGFFQHGGLGGKILHGLGEFALRYSAGEGNPYAMMVLRNRFEQQQAQVRLLEQVKQRQSERDEWTWREQWKLQHPSDQFTQYLQAAGIDPASPQGQALYRQRAESMAAPPLMAVDGFDAQNNPTKTFIPRTAFSAGGGGQPSSGPAVGTVRNGYRFQGGNPNDRNSWVPVGGASSSGGATFR
jgi:hypothetical protein